MKKITRTVSLAIYELDALFEGDSQSERIEITVEQSNPIRELNDVARTLSRYLPPVVAVAGSIRCISRVTRRYEMDWDSFAEHATMYELEGGSNES